MNNKFLVMTTTLVILCVRNISAAKRSGRVVSTIREKSTKIYDLPKPVKHRIEVKPGKPVPQARQLHRMITQYLFERSDSLDGTSIVNFLRGENPVLDKRLTNLTVLDPKAVKKMVRIAKEKDKKDIEADPSIIDTRRYAQELLVMTGKMLSDYNVDELEENERNFKEKLNQTRRQEHFMSLYDKNNRDWKEYMRSLMLQSIYQTRYNLMRTRKFRIRFRYNHSFQIAMTYGSVVETLRKIRELLTTCTRFHRNNFTKVKFLFYLVVYEKALAGYTDITFLVKEIFVIHKYFEAHLLKFLMDRPESTTKTA